MRPDWPEYFLGIARAVALRSDCERSKVGAVIVKDRRIRATGYNGAPARAPGCATCPRRVSEAVPGVSRYDDGATRCVAVHAEANALLYCDRADLAGATLYITREPCVDCSKLIAAAGITDVVWPEGDGWERNTYAFRMEPGMVSLTAEAVEPIRDNYAAIYREIERKWWDSYNARDWQIITKGI